MSAATPGASALSRDTRTALRNAVKLTVSLGATWTIGLVVRFWLPRYLGPERFGVFSFADGLAATVLGCTGLGIDTYITRVIPVRPAHASDFYGGAVLLRLALASVLVGGLMVVPLGSSHPDTRSVLLVFGLGYLFYALNGTLAALLQANATVDELAVGNVMTKVVWGAGMAVGILLGAPLVALAGVFAASEGLKLAVMQYVTRRRLALAVRVDLAATWTAMRSSFGFYVNGVALQLGWRLDIAMLGYLTQDADVGWYGASQSLANIALLLAPILSAVLMPLLARAHSRSLGEMYGVICRALEGIVSVTVPLALVLSLGAELWTRIAFGRAYDPAAITLRTLAPLFVFMYLNILLAAALIVRGRSWRLTSISLTGIGLHALAALLLVPTLSARIGPGGAGAGMALAGVIKEVYVCAAQLVSLGGEILDGPRRRMLARSLAAAALAVAVHAVLGPLGFWRLPVDLAVYVGAAVALGALKPRALVALAHELRSSRAGATTNTEGSR